MDKEHRGGSDDFELPFIPKSSTFLICQDKLRVNWFEGDFCQSRYSPDQSINGSNSCTIIVILIASYCNRYNIPKMGLLQLPMYMYAAFKESLTRLKIIKAKTKLIVLLSVILTVICAPICLTILTIFNILKLLINFYLQQNYQENYRGMMDGVDTICCSQKNCVLCIFTLIEYKDTLENLNAAIVKQLEKIMATRHEKMFYSRRSFLGYPYYFRKYIPPAKYIFFMDDTGEEYLDKKQFSEKFIPYDSSELPENDEALFQILICPQRILLDSDPTNKNIFAVIYRFHHCIGDGMSLFNLFKGVMADKEVNYYGHPPTNNGIVTNPSKLTASSIKNFMSNIRIKEFPIGSTDRNALRRSNLLEEKNLAWFSDSGTECMEKIRKLRKSVNGLTFLDVMNTCLSSSLYDYYKKIEAPIPKTVIGGVVLSPKSVSFTSYGIQDFNLINRFSVVSFNLPIDVAADNSNKLISRMRFVKKEYDAVKRSFDIQLNYWCVQNVVAKIPIQLVSFLSSFVEITIGISSLPGCEEFTFFGGNPVKEILIMPPNSPGTGLHTVIYTYKGHLRIGLTADKSVVPTFEGAQAIVDGMVSHLYDLSSICTDDLKC